MSTLAVHCSGLSKRFGSTSAVEDLALTVEQGEILVLLGPSGCGKTTTLRLIAGFDVPDAGTVVIEGKAVSGPGMFMPPEKRRVGMVFQEYALFPHMSVEDNISYGLARGRQRREQVQKVIAMTGLTGLEKRMPHQLSGGQQQRVALARALAPGPGVLLLDEPFSNLDATLRDQVRRETRGILHNSGTTAIFVTHSREEALLMGDVVGVMNQGKIEQVDTPQGIFHAPTSPFVASFMGLSDFLPARLSDGALLTELGPTPIPQGLSHYEDVKVMVRPDDVTLEPSETGQGTIEERTFQGASYLYRVALASGNKVHAVQSHTREYVPGTRVRVCLTPGHPLLCFVNGRAIPVEVGDRS
ncbi:MAG: ABC transporter ATP-binding protein [Chloroflexi bacterium]|nr:ABC transporter ATP-binding protein [Chloroflexota bacterium]